MNASKVIINGVETKFVLGIDEDEIETNEEFTFDTLNLEEVVDQVAREKNN